MSRSDRRASARAERQSQARIGDEARAAAAAVDLEALTAELVALVRIPSVTGHEDEIAAVLADRLEAAGLAVEVFHPDPAAIRDDPAWPGEEVPRETLPVVLGRAGRAGGRRIVLSGHHDVVPIGDPATWTADPFGGEIRDGNAVRPRRQRHEGRRGGDPRRAPGARGDRALRRLDGELIVALVPSEEDGGQGTLAAIRAGATGDLAIIPEPSLLDVVVAHAGAITFRLEVPGRAAHACKRREGVSALANLQVLLAALERDEARRNEEETDPLMTALGLPYPTIVGTVAGGEWASTVMDRVVVGGPLRRAARPVARGRLRRAAGGDRCRVRRGRLPARPSSVARAHRARGSGRRASRPTTRCRPRWPTSPRP